MLHSTSANSFIISRYPASILGRINDSIILSLRMGAASVHVLAFIILVDSRDSLLRYSLPTPYTESEWITQRDELQASLAFIFLCALVSLTIFITGVLIKYETLHFIQMLLHSGGAAMLLAVWDWNLHTNRVWHAFLFFSLLPVVIDVCAVLWLAKERRLWFM